MIEIELKILLDAADENRLRRHPALTRLRTAPRKTVNLVSVYFDTPDHSLAAAGIALRLRKVGRRWVQTVKFGKSSAAGLFARSEIEMPAPGGRLVLEGEDADGVFEAINKITDEAALSPVFETRIRRTVEQLAMEDGSKIELALDFAKFCDLCPGYC